MKICIRCMGFTVKGTRVALRTPSQAHLEVEVSREQLRQLNDAFGTREVVYVVLDDIAGRHVFICAVAGWPAREHAMKRFAVREPEGVEL